MDLLLIIIKYGSYRLAIYHPNLPQFNADSVLLDHYVFHDKGQNIQYALFSLSFAASIERAVACMRQL
jgi:hypothetical protein